MDALDARVSPSYALAGSLEPSLVKILLVHTPFNAVLRRPLAQEASLLRRSLLEHGTPSQDVLVATPAGGEWSWQLRMRIWVSVLRRLPRSQLVLLLDAADVLVVGSPQAIRDAYAALGGRPHPPTTAHRSRHCPAVPRIRGKRRGTHYPAELLTSRSQ